MPRKKILFPDPETRKLSLLDLRETTLETLTDWERDDLERMNLLREELGVPEMADKEAMWFQVALALARRLKRAPKSKGRDPKWTDLVRGVLVVEVDRIVEGKRFGASVSQACSDLAKKLPWRDFLEQIDSKRASSSDPKEALRKQYQEGRRTTWLKAVRAAYLMHRETNTLQEWDDFVNSVVRNKNAE